MCVFIPFISWGNKVTCLLGILMVGVMDILGAVLFLLRMDSCCLGLHDKNMRCEVMTIQNCCYALLSCPVFLLTDHAVGTGVTAFGIFWVTCIWRDLLPFFFFFLFFTITLRPAPHANTAVNPSTEYCTMCRTKNHFFNALSSC